MNSNFDLKMINQFNDLDDKKKKDILCIFNLNRYKFILDELKNIHSIVKEKKVIEKRITEIFKEGCFNFYIIHSNYICNIYRGASYYVYYNKENKQYYLYILKKTINDKEIYKGKFKLNEDLIWKKIE